MYGTCTFTLVWFSKWHSHFPATKVNTAERTVLILLTAVFFWSLNWDFIGACYKMLELIHAMVRCSLLK